MRDQFDFSMRGLQRRVSDLDREISTYTARVKAMPGEEVAYADISRKSTMVDSERNQTMAQLEQAKIDEDRAKSIKSQETKLVVPPRAEKLDSGGKTAILYAVGPLLGLVIAFCFSLLAESLDHTLRTPVEVEKYLGKSVLAVIPRMQTVRPSRKQLAGAAKRSLPS